MQQYERIAKTTNKIMPKSIAIQPFWAGSSYNALAKVRMFAVLDRRVGKRTLVKLKDTLEEQPLWLKQFYRLRFTAEGI